MHNEPETVLVVDDMPESVRLIERILTVQGYRVAAAGDGHSALRQAAATPPDLVLLDINMPDLSGYEVCDRFKADPRLRDIPVLFMSGMGETMDKVRAFAGGGVDYITKPFQIEELVARVQTHLRLRRLQCELRRYNDQLQELVQAQVREISDSQMAAIFALARLAESRDHDTGRHLERVQIFCRLLATALAERGDGERPDERFIQNLFHASPLHDIGKVGIPDRVLLKPDRLTPAEFALMQDHVIAGATTMEAVRALYPRNAFVNMGIEIARSHHERWDGAGYPQGLRGTDIPLSARIMAMADVYDALRSRRCYKQALPHDRSREIILAGRGTQFDPAVAAAFETLAETFERTWEDMRND